MESVTPSKLVEGLIFRENGKTEIAILEWTYFFLTDFPIAIFICYYVCLS